MNAARTIAFGPFLACVANAAWAGTSITPLDASKKLSGPIPSVLASEAWPAFGLDPTKLEWSDPHDGEVAAVLRYQDADLDGLPDAILALQDGAYVHWLFFRQRAIDEWTCLGTLGTLELRRSSQAALYQWWPQTMSLHGRSFLVAFVGPVVSSFQATEQLFELVHNDLRVIHSTEGRADRKGLGRFGLYASTSSRDIAFTEFRVGPTGAWLGWHAHLLREGETDFHPMTMPDDRAKWIPWRECYTRFGTDVEHLTETHPLQLARRIAIDHDLGADELAPVLARFKGSDPAVSYADFDADGRPDAFLAMRNGWTLTWLLFVHDAPGHWRYAGQIGDYWIEHYSRDDRHHTHTVVPSVQAVNGRSIIRAHVGAAYDLDSRIETEIHLLEDGQLTLLWSEPTFGHRVKAQRVYLLEYDGDSVLLLVDTSCSSFPTGEDEISETRAFVLLPDRKTLAPIDVPAAYVPYPAGRDAP